MEKDGLIIREHGGAYLKNIKDQVQTFSLTHQENLDKKALRVGKTGSPKTRYLLQY
jgi:DeoR/GlpR family transcriptional regulator of sugar metabolism